MQAMKLQVLAQQFRVLLNSVLHRLIIKGRGFLINSC